MPARVLVVDDNRLMRIILNEILVAGGFEIVGEAIDGIDAVNKYHQLKPDITIMDVVLPFRNGIETTKEILNEDPAAKIIVCSTFGRDSLVTDALDAGAKDCITKPFKAQDVIQAIRGVLPTQR